MPKPPGDPDYFDKVNYVIDAWSRPCEAPWYIYVNALKPAAFEAFITLISFGWGDVARGFARPPGTGRQRRRTGKRRGKWAKAIPRFPEIGNMIGKQIPGATAVQGIKYGQLGRFLWRIDTQLQAGLFYWLVADVTIDFAFNFTSQLYQTRWCEASDKGRFSYKKVIVEQILADVWSEVFFEEEDYEVSPPTWVITFGTSGPNGCTMGFGLDYEPFFPADPPTAYQARVVDTETGREIANTSLMPPDEFDGASAACIAYIPPNTRFRVEALAVGGRGKLVGGAIAATED